MVVRSVDPAVGVVIRQVRIGRGLTQQQLGALAGVTDATLRGLELGTKAAHRATLAAIASALGLSLDDLAARARAVAGL